MPDDLTDAIDLIREEAAEPTRWFDLSGWKAQVLLALFAGLAFLWLVRRFRRWLRRRRPPRLHPKLQKYGGVRVEDPKIMVKRRSEAERIIATSSRAGIVGYEVVEQLEAVFVDGFARPEDALLGLKATAAMKGANAVTNVLQKRDASGTCSAAGDAVVVHSTSPFSNGSQADDWQGDAEDMTQP